VNHAFLGGRIKKRDPNPDEMRNARNAREDTENHLRAEARESEAHDVSLLLFIIDNYCNTHK
jgi:hypothetical protein